MYMNKWLIDMDLFKHNKTCFYDLMHVLNKRNIPYSIISADSTFQYIGYEYGTDFVILCDIDKIKIKFPNLRFDCFRPSNYTRNINDVEFYANTDFITLPLWQIKNKENALFNMFNEEGIRSIRQITVSDDNGFKRFSPTIINQCGRLSLYDKIVGFSTHHKLTDNDFVNISSNAHKSRHIHKVWMYDGKVITSASTYYSDPPNPIIESDDVLSWIHNFVAKSHIRDYVINNYVLYLDVNDDGCSVVDIEPITTTPIGGREFDVERFVDVLYNATLCYEYSPFRD